MMESQPVTPLADKEDWEAILNPALCQDATAAEHLTRLLFTIKTLREGIELIYLHTNAHKAVVKLYVLSLEGNLKPQDEPLNLLNAALERGRSNRH